LWAFAGGSQGRGVSNNTPPEARRAIAGETLAARIIAVKTATTRTLITRFIDQPPISTDLSTSRYQTTAACDIV